MGNEAAGIDVEFGLEWGSELVWIGATGVPLVADARPGHSLTEAAHEVTVFMLVVKTVSVDIFPTVAALLGGAPGTELPADINAGAGVKPEVLGEKKEDGTVGELRKVWLVEEDTIELVGTSCSAPEPDIAAMLVIHTAESSKPSPISHSTNETECAPGVVVWLMYSGIDVNLYTLVRLELGERSNAELKPTVDPVR